jgi:hypothetical protein
MQTPDGYGGMATVATASYGVAGEMTGLNHGGYFETRTYNPMLQLTRMTASSDGMPYGCIGGGGGGAGASGGGGGPFACMGMWAAGLIPVPDAGCYAPETEPPAKRKPRPKPDCPDDKKNFFDTMIPIAANLADKWDSSTNDILALSAYESGWLGQHAQDLHNPFGLTQAGGNDLTFSSYQQAAAFWSKNDGKYIKGDKDIVTFANDIQPHYNTANPAWKSTLEDVYKSVLKWRSICDR